MEPVKLLIMEALTLLAVLGLGTPDLTAQQPAVSCCPPTCKVCVRERKQHTRKVYSCKKEEYCLPRCRLLSILQGKCDCDEGPCGKLKARHRLIVKRVPDCDTTQCVPREVPVPAGPGCPVPVPCPAGQPLSWGLPLDRQAGAGLPPVPQFSPLPQPR